jgi:RHS repeat-associated protein
VVAQLGAEKLVRWSFRLVALLIIVGIVLLPLRAVAATIPALFAYDVAIRSTKYDRPLRGRSLSLKTSVGTVVDLTQRQLTFVDVNRDGLMDVITTRGRLMSLFINDGRQLDYTYDDTDQRILKRVDGVPVRADLAGAILTEDHFIELVTIGGVVVGLVDNGQFTALLTDPRGTPFAAPDGSPGLATPFGVRATPLPISDVIDFARLARDPDLDLIRMGVRDYDPKLGQFLTPDPLYFEDLDKCQSSPIQCSLYGYAAGNPISFVDPTGMEDAAANPVLDNGTWELARSRFIMSTPQPPIVLQLPPTKADIAEMQQAAWDRMVDKWGPFGVIPMCHGMTACRVVTDGLLLASGVASGVGALLAAEDVLIEEGIALGVTELSGVGAGARALSGGLAAADATVAVGGGGITDPSRLLPERAGPTGHISPSEVAGRTPAQIDARARELGLTLRGADPAGGRGAYIDPQTGQQRILSHPNASPPHGHVNNPAGQCIDINGNVVPPESPAAHLQLGGG